LRDPAGATALAPVRPFGHVLRVELTAMIWAKSALMSSSRVMSTASSCQRQVESAMRSLKPVS
jgi:hypothetical protein